MIDYIVKAYILKCSNKPLYDGDKLTVNYFRLRNHMRNNKQKVPLSYQYIKTIKQKQVMDLGTFFKKMIEFGQAMRRKHEWEELERRIKNGEIPPIEIREEWSLSDLDD